MRNYTYTFIAALFFLPILPASWANTIDEQHVKHKSDSTMIQFSVWPTLYEWPTGLNVYGLRIGLPASYGGGTYVYGLDYALLISQSRNVKGLQLSFVNSGENGNGVQFGLFNIARTSGLLQIGIVNDGEDNSECLQIGLINKLDNGFLPIFPLINFSI